MVVRTAYISHLCVEDRAPGDTAQPILSFQSMVSLPDSTKFQDAGAQRLHTNSTHLGICILTEEIILPDAEHQRSKTPRLLREMFLKISWFLFSKSTNARENSTMSTSLLTAWKTDYRANQGLHPH